MAQYFYTTLNIDKINAKESPRANPKSSRGSNLVFLRLQIDTKGLMSSAPRQKARSKQKEPEPGTGASLAAEVEA